MATAALSVPVLSLAAGDADPADFAAALGGSFERFGFAVVIDHGIDPAVIGEADMAARKVFALPEAVKRAGHVPGTGGARGYTPFGIETAKDAQASDLKEFWHVGRDLPPGHRYAAEMRPNIWPDAVPQFRPALQALFAAFDVAGGRVLEGVARHLGLAADWFVDPVTDGNSVLRLLHYPPIAADAAGLRAGAHEDINVITLLLGAEEAGLELLTREGEWLEVTPPPGALVVNVGDMLQRLTGGRLRSTTHRVRNPAPDRRGHSRYSMPYFLHFRPDFMIAPLPGSPDPQPPITAQDYLMQRLREIRLL